jgi:hypothetical protein
MGVLNNDQFYNALDDIKQFLTLATASAAKQQQSHLAQKALTDIQETYQSLVDAKNVLEQQVVELRDWNVEKTNYKTYELPSGVLVYTKTPKAGSGAPVEWACPKCFHSEHKSFLVPGKNSTHITARCPECCEVFLVRPVGRIGGSVIR